MHIGKDAMGVNSHVRTRRDHFRTQNSLLLHTLQVGYEAAATPSLKRCCTRPASPIDESKSPNKTESLGGGKDGSAGNDSHHKTLRWMIEGVSKLETLLLREVRNLLFREVRIAACESCELCESRPHNIHSF